MSEERWNRVRSPDEVDDSSRRGRASRCSWVRTDQGLGERQVTFWCADIGIALGLGVAWRGDEAIGLRPLEARLLEFLFIRAGRLVPTTEVRRHLYGNVTEESATLRLRSLLTDMRRRIGAGMTQSLRTARGLGLILYARPQLDSHSSSSVADGP